MKCHFDDSKFCINKSGALNSYVFILKAIVFYYSGENINNLTDILQLHKFIISFQEIFKI